MRERLIPLAALAVSGVAACASIAGIDGDYRVGLDAGAEATASSTSSSGSSSTSSTSSSSSSSSSSGAPDDAGIDASMDAGDAEAGPVDAGPPPVCPANLPANELFCDDFETTADATSQYLGFTSASFGSATGKFSLGTGGVGVGEKDLSASLTIGDNNNTNMMLQQPLGNAFQQTQSSLTLDFDFDVTSTSATYLELGAIRVDASSKTEYGLLLLHDKACPAGQNSYCVAVTQPNQSVIVYDKAQPFSLNAWHHVKVTLTRTATGWNGSIIVDSQEPVDTSTDGNALRYDQLTNPSPTSNTKTDIVVGAFSGYDTGAYDNGNPPNNAAEIQFDNVIVTK